MNPITIEDLKNNPIWIVETTDQEILSLYLDKQGQDGFVVLKTYIRPFVNEQLEATGEKHYLCYVPAVPSFSCLLTERDLKGAPYIKVHRAFMSHLKGKFFDFFNPRERIKLFVIHEADKSVLNISDEYTEEPDLSIDLNIALTYAAGGYVTMYEAIEMIMESYGPSGWSYRNNNCTAFSGSHFQADFIGYSHCLQAEPELQNGFTIYQKKAVEQYIADLYKLNETFSEPEEYEEVGPFKLDPGTEIKEDDLGPVIPVKFINLDGEELDLCDEPVVEVDEVNEGEDRVTLLLNFRHGVWSWKILSMFNRGEVSFELIIEHGELVLVGKLDEAKLEQVTDF